MELCEVGAQRGQNGDLETLRTSRGLREQAPPKIFEINLRAPRVTRSWEGCRGGPPGNPVSYTHLRAHETGA